MCSPSIRMPQLMWSDKAVTEFIEERFIKAYGGLHVGLYLHALLTGTLIRKLALGPGQIIPRALFSGTNFIGSFVCSRRNRDALMKK